MPSGRFYEFCNSSLPSRFVEELFAQTVNLAKHRISPIWTLDSPTDQSYFYARGGEKQEKALETINEVLDRSLELGKLMGIPTVKGHAESLSSQIAATMKHTFMATDTLDGLMFAPDKLLVGLNKRHSSLCEVKLEVAFAKLGFTRGQFIDLCLLCQYISEHDVITPAQAYKLIEEFHSIESILKGSPEHIRHKLKGLDENKKQWNQNQSISDTQFDYRSIKWTKCDEEGLRTFLKEYKLSSKAMEDGIQILSEWKPCNNYIYQTHIDKYFNEKKKIPGMKLVKEKALPLRQTRISQFFEVKCSCRSY
eukprot:TRINITY_DN8433_c0_g1_i6.p1 TRINITY_DN8433_c0_g1~~TRINITY_DN8433_c0_g1_i6.p1  ORF type:complete len:308 (+),score=41.66 TRINITY_DN8433_c0_g1_i6:329-1252(+)